MGPGSGQWDVYRSNACNFCAGSLKGRALLAPAAPSPLKGWNTDAAWPGAKQACAAR